MNPQFSPVGAIVVDSTLSSAKTLYDPLDPPGDKIATMTLQVFAQDIYYTLDGTAPTTANAFKLSVGLTLTLDLTEGTTVKIIEAAASASVRYQFFRAVHYRYYP